MDESAEIKNPSQELSLELRRRSLTVSMVGLLVAGQFLILFAEMYHLHPNYALHGFALMTIALIAYLLSVDHYVISLALCIASFIALPILLALWLGSSLTLGLLALPMVLACASFGLRAGLVVAVSASVPAVAALGGSGRETVSAVAVLTLLWCVLAMVWLALRFGQQAIAWSWEFYSITREELESARLKRVELKQTQEDLEQANEELASLTDRLRVMHRVAEEARRAKEEFVANVSHELRTPLNMIIGFSEMISESPEIYGAPLPSQLLADIDVIQRNSRHLSSLVDDVLDLSRVDAGRMALTREWISVAEVVQSAEMAVSPLFESKRLRLEVDLPNDLPPVFCDRVRMRQVVLNLLSNAGRFTEEGGVTVRAEAQVGYVVVSVADTGPGISLEDQVRIFQPFEQYDGTTARQFGGSGLGLAVSKQFVELHGGKMWVESEPGKGATFYTSWPLEGNVPQKRNALTRWFSPFHEYETRTRPSRAPKPEPRPRFIVMESGDTLRRLLARYLPRVEVIAASQLDQAVQEAARLPPQVVVINSPAVGGYSPRLAAAKGLPYDTPVISCYLADTKDAADRLGVSGYLVKPVSRRELATALEGLGRPIRTVLIVDDNPEALQLFGRMLSADGQGYQILSASSGERGLALLHARQPDVVLLDLVMPGLDGYGVLREKNADPELQDIPVLAISALDPTPGGICTDYMAITRGKGLSLREFLSCLQGVSAVLTASQEGEQSRALGGRSL